jgi:hypothetical protein
MGTGAAHLDFDSENPLAARLYAGASRLAEDSGVPLKQVGGRRRDRQETVVLPGDFLPRIKGEGDVDRRFG